MGKYLINFMFWENAREKLSILFPTVKLLYTDLHAPVRKKATLVNSNGQAES